MRTSVRVELPSVLDSQRRSTPRDREDAAGEIVGVGEKVGLSVEALDKVDESASSKALRAAVDARLPKLDLTELILKIHSRIGFTAHFTHASESASKAEDIATTVCAVLLAEATNIASNPWFEAMSRRFAAPG